MRQNTIVCNALLDYQLLKVKDSDFLQLVYMPFIDTLPDGVFTLESHRVYDIVNAGPNHCFIAAGCKVHNCGYGGGVGALKAMGAKIPLDIKVDKD